MIYLMKGIPGCGKSTYIKNVLKPTGLAVICSADHHFEDEQGNYNFNPAEIGIAHAACLKKYTYAIQMDCDVIVDNTNIRLWEIAPYVALAEAFNKEYEIIEIVCEPSQAARRNTHGVPEEKVMEMYKNYEECLPWWNSKEVYV